MILLIMTKIKKEYLDKLKLLYLEGNSANQCKTKLNLSLSLRTIQRQIKKMGISRSCGDAYRLINSYGLITRHKKPEESKIKRKHISAKTRYTVY